MRTLAWSVVTAFVFLVLPAQAQTSATPATTSREQLTLLVNRLGKSPGDYVLRERIMKLAREIKPLPPIPEAADAADKLGRNLYNRAKTPEEFQGAVDAFRQVTTLAPWSADAYFNLGMAEEKAGRLAAADRSFGIYLLSNPDLDSARRTRVNIARIQTTEELMSKQVAANSITAEELLNALDGATYDCGSDAKYYHRVEIWGGSLHDNLVEIRPPAEVPPQTNTGWLQPADPRLVAPLASDRRQGLNFMKPYGRMHTVSPNQVERQGQSTCRRIRGSM